MTIRIAYVAVVMFLTTYAVEATEPPPLPPAPQTASSADLPVGAPYNVGAMAANERLDNWQVSLRDYLSSRLDQIRTELLDKIEAQTKILDERDRQYSQRFEAQQEALSAARVAAKEAIDNALLSQKEAVANALSAAKEAVTKAEEAANKRFDSVNEFRNQLDDQARTFVTKDAAEVHFKALEDKVLLIANQQANYNSNKEGANSTWALVAAAIIFLIGVGSFAMRFRKEPA